MHSPLTSTVQELCRIFLLPVTSRNAILPRYHVGATRESRKPRRYEVDCAPGIRTRSSHRHRNRIPRCSYLSRCPQASRNGALGLMAVKSTGYHEHIFCPSSCVYRPPASSSDSKNNHLVLCRYKVEARRSRVLCGLDRRPMCTNVAVSD